MSIQLLRETIRRIILEGRNYYRSSSGNGIIILEDITSNKFVSPRNRLYISFESAAWLSDPAVCSLLADPISNAGKIAAHSENQILGMCLLEKGVEGVAYGASQIKLSAAKSGYGPALYDIVMSTEPNGIYPDRGDVSHPAYNMYNYYNISRFDVKKKKLDDIDMKYTPDTIDDVPQSSDGFYLEKYDYDEDENKNYSNWSRDKTNWVYSSRSIPDSGKLFENGQIIYNRIEDIVGPDKCKQFLDILASKYFDIRQMDDE